MVILFQIENLYGNGGRQRNVEEKQMRKLVLTAMLVLCTSGAALAQDGQLHGTIDATYVSRYIWRGYDAYGNNHSAFQPSVDLDFFRTGFGLNVWMSRANGSGFENSEWLTYTPYYKGVLFEDEAFATYFKIGYTYFSYPDSFRACSSFFYRYPCNY